MTGARVNDGTLNLVIIDVGMGPFVEVDVPENVVVFPGRNGLSSQMRMYGRSNAAFLTLFGFQPVALLLPWICRQRNKRTIAVRGLPVYFTAPGMELSY